MQPRVIFLASSIIISPAIRRLAYLVLLGVLVVLVAVLWQPVHSTSMKLGSLLLVGTLWFGLLVLFWRFKGARFGMLSLLGLAVLAFALPSREIDTETLRRGYLEKLKGFEGTKYHWGGENSIGIDCSGLPRRAYRDALLCYGLRHLNGRAIRAWGKHWWYDASAEALGAGYRDYTVPVVSVSKDETTPRTIQAMSYDHLTPGDLAMTDGGAHMLVYVGGEEWIQADPGKAKVVLLNARSVKNVWFRIPVTCDRWAELADGDE